MRTSRNLHIFTIFLLYLSTFAAAWPWPRWLPELDSLVVRDDPGNSTAAATSSASPKETGSNTDTNSKTDSNSKTETGSNTASATGSGATSKPKSSSATKTHTTSYDNRLPAGGVSMMTPAIASGAQYYKIGDFVTFGWNYTSLEATPTAVNVLASCSANSEIYTLASNVTVANNTGAVTWDTGAYQATAVQNPLLTETYTLIIYDAASSISATAQAGYLAVYNQYTFGMYAPQAYTPLSEFKCATCSGALGDMERRALGMMLGMGLLSVLSGLWFVGGLGIAW